MKLLSICETTHIEFNLPILKLQLKSTPYMPVKQRTISKESSIKGKSLHTGNEVTLTFKPAAPKQVTHLNALICMVNQKLNRSFFGSMIYRSTTILNGNAKVHTIEHVLSALSGWK